MRRAIVLALGLVMLAGTAWAELRYTKVLASSAGADTVTIQAGTLVVVNDGASTIHVRVFWTGETPADATQSSPEIKSGESFTFSKTEVLAISIISESSSTVRLFYW